MVDGDGFRAELSPLATILLTSWLAGVAAFVGGIVARYEAFRETEGKQEALHAVVAFGGGVLLAAVAFALAPEAIAGLSTPTLAGTFLLGGFVFVAVDAELSRRVGSEAQLTAMLLDFVPEAISLGAVFGYDRRLGFLLAGFIGLQNLPEGFNSFREIAATGTSTRTALKALLAISLLGPAAAASGYFWLQESPELTAGIMSFAAGGILYLIFQDIAPQAKMRRHWAPPMGAVLGFALGMIGDKVLG